MKLNSKYWENRYKNNDIGWDCGMITTPLKDYIDQISDTSLKILIPGAGNSYEFEYLIQKGFTNVSVLDYAPTPLNKLKEKFPHVDEKDFIEKDFFKLENQFDVIIEQTFFCALDLELRIKYAKKMHSLLKPKGIIVGVLFQFPLTEVGPPFGGSIEEYQKLFQTDFHIKKLETAYNSIKPREGKELFFIFTKK